MIVSSITMLIRSLVLQAEDSYNFTKTFKLNYIVIFSLRSILILHADATHIGITHIMV